MNLIITQVSEKYNITPDTLRYYERIELLPNVPRQSNGNSYYDDSVQEWIEMIVCLRHSGVPVEKLVDYAEMIQKGDSTLQAREDLLKEQLANLKEQITDDRLGKHRQWFKKYFEIGKFIPKLIAKDIKLP